MLRIKETGLLILALFFCGCGLKVVSYAQDKPRVDQEIAGIDNEGYVGGSMKSTNLAHRKKTRKVYVVEVSKGSGNIKPLNGDIPSAKAGNPAAPRSVQYTVEKDDTLQSIAKKFYDSYNQWTRIYEANKSVIGNPDRIRAGTVLEIPMDK